PVPAGQLDDLDADACTGPLPGAGPRPTTRRRGPVIRGAHRRIAGCLVGAICRGAGPPPGPVTAAPTAAATAARERKVRSVWKAAHRARKSCQSAGSVPVVHVLILLSMGTSTASVTVITARISNRPTSASQAATVGRWR